MGHCDSTSIAAERPTPDVVTTETVVETLVDAIADEMGTDPLRLDQPLAAVIDPDAVASLLAGADDCVVEFAYADLRVSIDETLTVTTTRREGPAVWEPAR